MIAPNLTLLEQRSPIRAVDFKMIVLEFLGMWRFGPAEMADSAMSVNCERL